MCGAVQWEVQGAPVFSVYCHCSFCRSNHGADVVHQVGFLSSAVKFNMAADDNLIRYVCGGKEKSVRCGCKVELAGVALCCADSLIFKVCGAKCHNVSMGGNGYGFPAASFASGPAVPGQPTAIPEVLKATSHINYESRVAEYNDSLPKFLDFPAPFGSGKMFEGSLTSLCQSFYAAFGKGEIMTIVDACSENIRWTGSGLVGTPLNDTFEGRDGMLRFFQHIGKEVKWSSFTPERFIEAGNTVVVLGTAKGTIFHHPEATWWFTHVWVFGPDKKLVEVQDQWCASNTDAAKIYGSPK